MKDRQHLKMRPEHEATIAAITAQGAERRHSDHPPFDERGVGRYHDADLMAATALRAHRRGDRGVVLGAILLPGVLDRLAEMVPDWNAEA